MKKTQTSRPNRQKSVTHGIPSIRADAECANQPSTGRRVDDGWLMSRTRTRTRTRGKNGAEASWVHACLDAGAECKEKTVARGKGKKGRQRCFPPAECTAASMQWKAFPPAVAAPSLHASQPPTAAVQSNHNAPVPKQKSARGGPRPVDNHQLASHHDLPVWVSPQPAQHAQAKLFSSSHTKPTGAQCGQTGIQRPEARRDAPSFCRAVHPRRGRREEPSNKWPPLTTCQRRHRRRREHLRRFGPWRRPHRFPGRPIRWQSTSRRSPRTWTCWCPKQQRLYQWPRERTWSWEQSLRLCCATKGLCWTSKKVSCVFHVKESGTRFGQGRGSTHGAAAPQNWVTWLLTEDLAGSLGQLL